MSVEAQIIIDVVLIIGAGAGGWIMKIIWDRINHQEAETEVLTTQVNQLKVLVAGDYVKSSKFDEVTTRIFDKLEIISNKLGEVCKK